MGKGIQRVASFLSKLNNSEYGVPHHVSGAINYLLDSWIAKQEEYSLILQSRRGEPEPIDPYVHIKELWMDCEIQQSISLNKTYPSYSKNQTAYAFHCLFGPNLDYEVVPFIESYPYKDYIKQAFKIQSEQLQVAQGIFATIPIFGLYFVRSVIQDIHLIVNFDFCYDRNVCTITVCAHPSQQQAAETFLADLEASTIKNDIYYKQCLSFNRGLLDFEKITNTTWADLVLKPEVVEKIRVNSVGVLENIDKLISVGMCPNRNLLLISPPGMAKTTLFRAVSNELQGSVTRIWCTGKSILYPEEVTALFGAAREMAPCIVFIEDMDLFGRSRELLSGTDSQVLNEFLTCLDGTQENSGIVIMASTNDAANMDEAILNRPGRFDVKVMMPAPDNDDRAKMLGKFLKKMCAQQDGTVNAETWKIIIERTDGLTGAYIKDLAKSVILRAVSRDSCKNGHVFFSADDLNAAADQVMENFSIGKLARKHIQPTDRHSDAESSG